MQEEGVVVKKLHGPWNFMKRTCDWVKLKPDYVKLQVCNDWAHWLGCIDWVKLKLDYVELQVCNDWVHWLGCIDWVKPDYVKLQVWPSFPG